MTLGADAVARLGCELGESPLWVPERHELVWLDINGEHLHRLALDAGTVQSVRLSAMVTALGLVEGPGLVSATATGFGFVDPDSGTVTQRSVSLVRTPGDRMNDGAVAPDGSFWAGSCVDEAARPATGSLWRWREGRDPELVLDGVTTSNGIDWLGSGDQALLYVDSATGGIDRLTLDDHDKVTERVRIAEVDPADGEPDGLCLDEDDHAWVAIWGAGEVRAYDADGAVQEVIALPARNPSSCIFGGTDRRTLFITSAREDLSDPGPLDGALFACRLPRGGRAPRRFLVAAC